MYVKRAKCEFGKQSIDYLGHTVSAAGVPPDPKKIAAVASWPEPKCVKEVQSFLGLTNYYAQFIPQYAARAAPLTYLCCNDVAFQWGTPQQ